MPTDTFFNLPADKRARIVEAALDEFALSSYESASISRMVARAGIAKGSFYQYFESKLDLFEWLLLHELTQRKLAFVQSHVQVPAGADFFATIEAMITAGLGWALHEPRLARMLELLWSTSPHPELRELVRRTQRLGHQSMVVILEKGQQAGQVRADLDLELAAAVLIATLQQGSNRALQQRFGLDLIELMHQPEVARSITVEQLQQLAAQLLDLVRRGFGCPGGSWSPERLDLQELNDRILGER